MVVVGGVVVGCWLLVVVWCCLVLFGVVGVVWCCLVLFGSLVFWCFGVLVFSGGGRLSEEL